MSAGCILLPFGLLAFTALDQNVLMIVLKPRTSKTLVALARGTFIGASSHPLPGLADGFFARKSEITVGRAWFDLQEGFRLLFYNHGFGTQKAPI